MTMQFETCPRCGDDWREGEHFLQSACGMWLIDPYLFMPVGDIRLVWDSKEQCCFVRNQYSIARTGVDVEDIDNIYNSDNWLFLPWLPSDITEERLKLLLVFS